VGRRDIRSAADFFFFFFYCTNALQSTRLENLNVPLGNAITAEPAQTRPDYPARGQAALILQAASEHTRRSKAGVDRGGGVLNRNACDVELLVVGGLSPPSRLFMHEDIYHAGGWPAHRNPAQACSSACDRAGYRHEEQSTVGEPAVCSLYRGPGPGCDDGRKPLASPTRCARRLVAYGHHLEKLSIPPCG